MTITFEEAELGIELESREENGFVYIAKCDPDSTVAKFPMIAIDGNIPIISNYNIMKINGVEIRGLTADKTLSKMKNTPRPFTVELEHKHFSTGKNVDKYKRAEDKNEENEKHDDDDHHNDEDDHDEVDDDRVKMTEEGKNDDTDDKDDDQDQKVQEEEEEKANDEHDTKEEEHIEEKEGKMEEDVDDAGEREFELAFGKGKLGFGVRRDVTDNGVGVIVVDKISDGTQASSFDKLSVGCRLLRMGDDFVVNSETTKKDVIKYVKSASRPLKMIFQDA
eukprot:g2983.t1